MITLADSQGTRADFTDTGDLVALSAAGVEWRLPAPAPGWSLLFTAGLARRPAAPRPGSATAVTRSPATAAHLHVTWDAVCRADGTRLPVNVAVEWWLADGLLHARATLRDLPPGEVLHALVMPDLALPCARPQATTLVLPRETGLIVLEAAQGLFEAERAPGEARLGYPGHLHMQFVGWCEDERQFYTDARDDQGWIKEWRVYRPAAGQVGLQCAHLAPRTLTPPDTFALPYPITVGALRGGWYEAGRTYRRWALTTPWAARGPAERRGSYLADVACWVWNRGRIANVVPPVRELARRLGLPLALDWYWWHHHPYDTQYPDYFPPREGEAPFRAAVRELQAENVAVQVYTNGMCYDLDGAAWPAAGPASALIKEDGGYHAPAYNAFMRHRLADTCGGAAAWREVLFGLVRQGRDLGLNGQYLDMIAAVGGLNACYHRGHGHAPGGGCYGVQGFRDTLRLLRAAHPHFPLTSEATSECFLDLFDGLITCGISLERLKWQAEHYGGRTRTVPLFSAVYHGHCICFGNYSLLDGVPPFDELWPPQFRTPPAAEKDWLTLCPDQFALELARTVCFGHQPMVCNLTAAHWQDPRLAGELAYLLEVARFYHAQREFLLWGELLPPATVECPEREITFLQRFIFTAPGEETYLRRVQPLVFSSCWRSPAGELAAMLFNYAREDVALTFTPPPGFRLADGTTAAHLTLPARRCALLPLRE